MNEDELDIEWGEELESLAAEHGMSVEELIATALAHQDGSLEAEGVAEALSLAAAALDEDHPDLAAGGRKRARELRESVARRRQD